MTSPTPTFDVAFTTDPLTAPSWTALAARLHSITANIGRDALLDEVDTATASMQVDNSDRALDPLHAAGPYFGNLKPRKRVRWRATYAGTTYDLYYGFLNGFAQQFSPPEVSVSPLAAGDGLKILAGMELPPSVYSLVVETAAPDHWWPLGATSLTVDDVSGGILGVVTGSNLLTPDAATLADPPLAVFDPRPGFSWPVSASDLPQGMVILIPPAANPTVPFSVEFLFRAGLRDETTSRKLLWSAGDPSTSNPGWQIQIGNVSDSNPGEIEFQYGDGTEIIQAYSTVRCDDNATHHVVVTLSGATPQIYVDGLDVTNVVLATGSPASITTNQIIVGGNKVYGDGDTTALSGFDGDLAHIAFYGEVLDAAEVAVHAAAASAPWDGDTTGERISRVLDLCGWPAGDRNIDTGYVTALGPADFGGSTVLAYCQLITRTEHGAFYVDHADGGNLRFADRHHRLEDSRSVTSQATLTDDNAGTLHFDSAGLVYLFDEDLVYNDITVQWVGGSVNRFDQTSIDDHTRHAFSVDTVLTTEVQAAALAEWVLVRFKDPAVRVPSITLTPASDARLWATALGSRVGDRVSLRHHPQQVGSAVTFDCWIEGIDRQADDGVNVWSARFALSAAEPLASDADGWWTLGTSQLGTNTRLAA